MLALNAIAAFGRGKKTEAAATRIRALVPGDRHGFTYLTFLRYTAAATAHTLTMMRGHSFSRTTTAIASGVTVVVEDALTDAAGNALAAADVVAIQLADDSWHLGVVDTGGWNAGTKTITLTAGTTLTGTVGVAAGGRVISYGVAGDSGHANYTLTAGASATTNYPAVANSGPLAKSAQRNEPIIVDSDNATAAGTLEAVSAVYAKR